LPDVLNDNNLRVYQTKLTELRRERAGLDETFTVEHPKVKRMEAEIASLQESLDRQRADILARIKNEYDEAMRREKLTETSLLQQTGLLTEQGEKAIRYNILRREAETSRQLYDAMLMRVKSSSLASALRASNIRIVDPAKPPKRPYRPNFLVNSAVGLLSGLFCAVVLVVMKARADQTLQDPQDVTNYLSLSVLGLIPSMKRAASFQEKRGDTSLLPGGSGRSEQQRRMALEPQTKHMPVIAERFTAALASILFASNGPRPKTLVVTSASLGEGKTTVCTNLAVAMAALGRRVLLVDADLRRPTLHKLFKLSNEAGLTTLTQQEDEAARAGGAGTVKGTSVEGLFVLTSGPEPTHPTKFFFAAAFTELLRSLEAEYDMIFVDTPPMLDIPDARVIGKVASAVVLVVRANQTTRAAAEAARSRLMEDGVKMVGSVLNDWDPRRAPGGYYGYYGKYCRTYCGAAK